LLLSATLGPHELQDLHGQFSRPGPCTLVAANALRPEPELWVAAAQDEQQRAGWVLDALTHLPRPAVLYVTKPGQAEWWADRLPAAGAGDRYDQRHRPVAGADRAARRERGWQQYRPGRRDLGIRTGHRLPARAHRGARLPARDGGPVVPGAGPWRPRRTCLRRAAADRAAGSGCCGEPGHRGAGRGPGA